MKTYLIVGGAGFIGTNLVRFIKNKYHSNVNIVIADSLCYVNRIDIIKEIIDNDRITFKKVDIKSLRDVSRLFDLTDYDVIVNLAAENSLDNNSYIFTENNVLGTHILLESAYKKWRKNNFKDKKFIQISSDKVYGSANKGQRFNEKTNINPICPYSASKAAADALVLAYYNTYNMPVNILRCCKNYGTLQYPKNLIPQVIKELLKNKKINNKQFNNNIHEWIHVIDNCRAIDFLIENALDGEIYNIGSGVEKSNIDIVRFIIEIISELLSLPEINYKRCIEKIGDENNYSNRYIMDSTKIRNLGWKPYNNFYEGLIKTVQWYVGNNMREWVS